MIKRIALFLSLALLLLLTSGALALDTTSIKGTCKDEAGKPVADATVELTNLDNGRTVSAKTDNHGQYSSLGTGPGKYKVTLNGADGKLLFYLNNVPVQSGVENVVDFDLAKFKAEAEKDPGNEAQRKEVEKVKKENEKIKGINALLQQAAQQKKENNYDAAVATMEQAAAQDQTHDVVYASLGDAYLGAKKYPEAETAYTKALALAAPASKSLGAYHSSLALALMKEGKTDLSIAECDKAAQLDPTTAGQCYFNQGAILTNQGKVDDANAAFDKAIAADPNRAEAYYQKGINLLGKATLGKDGKMIPVPGTAEALNKYLQLAPDGKNAQAAKDLLASIGAAVETSYGTKKSKK
jgi:tetratricopeptide (TPR) repeat protein